MTTTSCIEPILMLTMMVIFLSCDQISSMQFEGFPQQHSVVKRMNLETCLDRFDVHQNTIIRTEESRSMGAKFLDDADLSSQEQCLRLCCETENCDVFVFEEKNQGTCFLFQCGPPTDFHCKFTHHFNYTSAVLKIPTIDQPPPPPLVSQIHSLSQLQPVAIVPKLSQHELELVNLKAPKPSIPSSTTTLLPPLGVQLGRFPQSTSTTPKPSTPVPCRLYEFACHSGECIAVYNACDGIPQCADGSDEGPECRRPASTKNFLPQAQLQQPLMQQPNLMNGMSIQKQMMPQIFQTDLQQQQLRGLQQQQQQDQQKVIHNREDPMTAPRAWPKSINDPQPAYIDPTDSRIFSHKGGLQIASNNMAPPQYQDTLPDTNYVPNIPRNNGYMPIPFNYQPGPPQMNDPRMGPPQNPMWPQQAQQLPQEQYVQPPLQHQPDLNQQQPPQLTLQSQQGSAQQQPQQQPSPQTQVQPPPNTQPKLAEPPAQESPAKKPPNESHKSSEEYDSYDEHEYQDAKHPSTNSGEDQQQQPEEQQEKPNPPKKKQHKHRKQHNNDEHEHGGEKKKKKSKTSIKKDKAGEHGMPPVHEHLKMLRNDLEIEFADHDGQAERPGGAVLSLTLGAILTAALAILIGCRMKVARRRIRRQGKSSYAHDPDFLVNGMYL